jgi:hypothetical protein
MAYTTIPKPSAYFNTNLYTGNDTADTTITGVGFQSDFTWIKSRTTTENHHAFDSVRGGGYRIYPNLDNAQSYIATTLTSWTSDGFVVGTDDGVNANGANFVAWNWKAGTAVSGATTGSGTAKTYTGSVNTTSGLSIVSYTGNGTAGHTIPHNLGVAPTCIILKRYDGGTTRWFVYSKDNGNTAWLELNTSDSIWNSRTEWNSTTPTSSVFSVGNQSDINADGYTYVAYCFADVQGYSKFGTYTGNGSTDGAFVYTGFKPALVILKKNSSAGTDWQLYDDKRLGYNGGDRSLAPNSNAAEETGQGKIDFVSNGFKLRTSSANQNAGGVYTYIALASEPLVSTNGNAATAR